MLEVFGLPNLTPIISAILAASFSGDFSYACKNFKGLLIRLALATARSTLLSVLKLGVNSE